jgi:hypothetical protein
LANAKPKGAGRTSGWFNHSWAKITASKIIAPNIVAPNIVTPWAFLQALRRSNILPLDLNCGGQGRENAQGKLNAEFRACAA